MARSPMRVVFCGAALLLCGCEPVTENGNGADAEIPVLSGGDTSRDFGQHVVHFNALPTAQLDPEIASEYGIVRSESRAMLTVSILQKREGTENAAVPGSVSASAINLTGQLKNVSMREIREGDAIYYIGETPVADGETLVFTIDVTPINDPSRYTVRFMKQFFVD